MAEKSLSVREAAARARRSEQTIRNWTNRGLPYTIDESTDRILIRAGDLDGFPRPAPGRRPKAVDFDALAERSLELFFFELQLLLEEHESRVVRLVKSWRPVLTKELDDLERTGRISSLTALPALAVSIARLQPWVKSGKDGQTVSPGLTKTSFLLQPPPLVGETPHPDVLRRMREVHRWVLVGIPFTQIAPRVNETEDTARRDERAWQRIYGPTPKDLAAQLDELKARGSVVTETPVRIVYRISDVGQSLPDPELAKEEVNE